MKKTKFSKTEDFLKFKLDAKYPLVNIREVPYIIKTPSARRNKPCPCGSNLKYKFCCLAKETQKEIDIELSRQDKEKLEAERKAKGIVALG